MLTMRMCVGEAVTAQRHAAQMRELSGYERAGRSLKDEFSTRPPPPPPGADPRLAVSAVPGRFSVSLSSAQSWCQLVWITSQEIRLRR